MKKNIIKLLCILNFVIISFNSCFISAGSYPYAEKYNLNISETELIEIIKSFKRDNPEYCVPDSIVIDGKDEHNDHYYFYFYYRDYNQIIFTYTWVKQLKNKPSILAFIAINEGLELGHWKDINKDFSKAENKIQKAKFEKRILNKIKSKINEKKS